jgi:hypothetical protein
VSIMYTFEPRSTHPPCSPNPAPPRSRAHRWSAVSVNQIKSFLPAARMLLHPSNCAWPDKPLRRKEKLARGGVARGGVARGGEGQDDGMYGPGTAPFPSLPPLLPPSLSLSPGKRGWGHISIDNARCRGDNAPGSPASPASPASPRGRGEPVRRATRSRRHSFPLRPTSADNFLANL